MEHSKHVARMALLVVFVLVVFHIVRTLFTPPSFGKYGHYRADNVTEQMSKQVIHGGSISCEPCHGEKQKDWAAQAHKSVQCEVCHGPIAWHISDGTKVADMPRSRSAAFCLRCHERLNGRPVGFPQIIPDEHLRKVGGEMGPEVCLSCHDPHAPALGG